MGRAERRCGEVVSAAMEAQPAEVDRFTLLGRYTVLVSRGTGDLVTDRTVIILDRGSRAENRKAALSLILHKR